ncbi:MAG: serine hydrolase, partial [Candidatus Eremiobacteraeota bacterium]|nr:serine hydrolase [Candidatus Eremiobacteraeota bacterium]
AGGLFVCPGFVQLWFHPPGESNKYGIKDLLGEGVTCGVKLGSPGDFIGHAPTSHAPGLPLGKIVVVPAIKENALFDSVPVGGGLNIDEDIKSGAFGIVGEPGDLNSFGVAVENKVCYVINPDPVVDPEHLILSAIELARKSTGNVILPLPYRYMTPGQVDRIRLHLDEVRDEKLSIYIAIPQVPGGGYTTMRGLLLPDDRGLSRRDKIVEIRNSFNKHYPGDIYPIIPGRKIVSLSYLAKVRNKRSGEMALELMEKNKHIVVYCSSLIEPETYNKLITFPEVFVVDAIPVGLRGNEGLNSVPWRFSHMKNMMDIEVSVKKITSLPARAMGIVKHGTIRVSGPANITIIDPKGCLKPFAPEGYVRDVLINGHLVLKNGIATGLCDQVVAMRRGFGDQRTFTYFTTVLASLVKELGGDAGIAIFNFKTGDTWNLNGDKPLFMAGAMRLPVLCTLLYNFTEGRLPYEKKVTINHDDQYPEGGIVGILDTPVALTMRDLSRFTGSLEDDTALDKLIGIMGLGNINKTMELVGRKDIVLNATLKDLYLLQAGVDIKKAPYYTPHKAWEKYLSVLKASKTHRINAEKLPPQDLVFTGINQASPTSLLLLLKNMYEMKILDRENTNLFKGILLHNLQPLLCDDLPYGTGSISMGGMIGKNIADVAVINTPAGPVGVVVIVNNFSGDTMYDVDEILARIGRTIYDFYSPE